MEYDPRFQQFVSLFNRGAFFAAHEALEELWLGRAGPDRPFLQGLIQVAVALEHRARGNPRGARGVLASARRNLSPFLPIHDDIDLDALLREAARHLEEPAQWPPPRLVAGAYLREEGAVRPGSGGIPDRYPERGKGPSGAGGGTGGR